MFHILTSLWHKPDKRCNQRPWSPRSNHLRLCKWNDLTSNRHWPLRSSPITFSQLQPPLNISAYLQSILNTFLPTNCLYPSSNHRQSPPTISFQGQSPWTTNLHLQLYLASLWPTLFTSEHLRSSLFTCSHLWPLPFTQDLLWAYHLFLLTIPSNHRSLPLVTFNYLFTSNHFNKPLRRAKASAVITTLLATHNGIINRIA